MNPPVQPVPTAPGLAALVPRIYPLLVDAVECGLECGWNRAYKHDDNPPEHTIKAALHDAVVNEILERFDILQPPTDTE